MALLKKPSLGVALSGEQEIDSIALVINCPIILAPLASYFYSRLVHPATITWSFFPLWKDFPASAPSEQPIGSVYFDQS